MTTSTGDLGGTISNDAFFQKKKLKGKKKKQNDQQVISGDKDKSLKEKLDELFQYDKSL